MTVDAQPVGTILLAGLLLAVVVTATGIQDRDGAHRLLAVLRDRFSRIALVGADGGYAERLVRWAKSVLPLGMEIVTRNDDVRSFAVLPRRWVVERTLAWLYNTAAAGATTRPAPTITRRWCTSLRSRRSHADSPARHDLVPEFSDALRHRPEVFVVSVHTAPVTPSTIVVAVDVGKTTASVSATDTAATDCSDRSNSALPHPALHRIGAMPGVSTSRPDHTGQCQA
ncbi:transposase [Rhodococcus aetherivorans]|uniref:transposase n=1 Tax=Rhodococcus aetherivorans TaxID=191292 RepID=UPI0038902305